MVFGLPTPTQNGEWFTKGKICIVVAKVTEPVIGNLANWNTKNHQDSHKDDTPHIVVREPPHREKNCHGMKNQFFQEGCKTLWKKATVCVLLMEFIKPPGQRLQKNSIYASLLLDLQYTSSHYKVTKVINGFLRFYELPVVHKCQSNHRSNKLKLLVAWPTQPSLISWLLLLKVAWFSF